MQLHPDDAKNSAFYSQQSLAVGLIGLDFATEVGDLLASDHDGILVSQKDYLNFASNIEIGDKVLIISHHYPVAVLTVSGEYNYIRRKEPKLGVWFRHFRRIQDIKYFADHVTHAQAWEQYVMTDTISTLVDKNSKSNRLIDEMSKET